MNFNWTESLSPDTQENLEMATRDEKLTTYSNEQRLNPKDAIQSIGEKAECPVIESFEIAENPTSLLPLRLIHEFQCVPIKSDKTGLQLVTLWPPDAIMEKWIFATCGQKPTWYLAIPDLVSNSITEQFGVGSDSLEDEEAELFQEDESDEEEDQDAAIIRFVNEVIQQAVSDRATDIHFEPHKEALQIRYRIDGQLVPVRVPDNLVHFQSAIISRLKIMSKLNISEKRRPQDGRINFNNSKNEVDIRISTFPTMYGESISLRLLNQKNQQFTVQQLGLLPEDQLKVNQSLTSPHGIVLVTGPTGAGKSTSLSAFMRLINKPERRIITVEDPVEYEIPGINQTQVHPDIGLTFASALRHVLRQDPDVIMVGEIRDAETADIGIRASLTGHLVMSTLHTNDASGAITRLLDMEIEPFLLASSLEMVIAQRLVRKLCPSCKLKGVDTEHLKVCLYSLGLMRDQIQHAPDIYQNIGCKECRQLGYRGRIGVFEILNVDDELEHMIQLGKTAIEVRETAIRNGMRTLVECGWEQVKLGNTSIDEIVRISEQKDD